METQRKYKFLSLEIKLYRITEKIKFLWNDVRRCCITFFWQHNWSGNRIFSQRGVILQGFLIHSWSFLILRELNKSDKEKVYYHSLNMKCIHHSPLFFTRSFITSSDGLWKTYILQNPRFRKKFSEISKKSND